MKASDNSDSHFEWPTRAETVPQVCWWRDHRGPGQRLITMNSRCPHRDRFVIMRIASLVS